MPWERIYSSRSRMRNKRRPRIRTEDNSLARTIRSMGQKRPPTVYYAFDLLRINGRMFVLTNRRKESQIGGPATKAASRYQVFYLVYGKDQRAFGPRPGLV